MSEFAVKILSPGGLPVERIAQSVLFHIVDGETEIYPDHAPALFQLGKGELVIRNAAGPEHWVIQGGIAHFENSVLTFLAEKAENAATA